MRCIECGEDTRVLTTYQNEDGRVKRRRECVVCKTRFTTRENAENATGARVEVVAREQLELFEREVARADRSED